MSRTRDIFDVITEMSTSARRRGRVAAASRDQVLALAMSRYLHGRRVDVQAIASELAIGRPTIYPWSGSPAELIGAAPVRPAEPLLPPAPPAPRGRGGPA